MASPRPQQLKSCVRSIAPSNPFPTRLEVISLKFRLMLELKLVNETQIFQIQTKLTEIGRMLGGWLKASQS